MAMLATPEDVAPILRLISMLPYPPRENRDSIIGHFEEDIVAVDHRSCVRARVFPRDQKIVIIWWMWDGTDRVAWLRCLLFVLNEIRSRHGEQALNWIGEGEFSGAGNTDTDRKADARIVARAALPGHGTVGDGGRPTPVTLEVGIALIQGYLDDAEMALRNRA